MDNYSLVDLVETGKHRCKPQKRKDYSGKDEKETKNENENLIEVN